MLRGGRQNRPWRGIIVEYEETGAKKMQLMALLMTIVVVGGAIYYAIM
jgi:hypothetical protein